MNDVISIITEENKSKKLFYYTKQTKVFGIVLTFNNFHVTCDYQTSLNTPKS